MKVWSTDPKTFRLFSTKLDQDLDNFFSDLRNDNMGDETPPRTLNDIFYPARSSQPSCFVLPAIRGNVNFELKHHNIVLLPKFSGVEDPYLFLREFDEICATMQYPGVTNDGLRLRAIPFALKTDAKKWMYGLPPNSIDSWDVFVFVFLKKYFPNGKTVRLRNEINQFIQLERESFWKYLDRFKDLLAQCPHHGFEKSRLCQIVYEGLDPNSRTMLESMCQGNFLGKTIDEAWEFLEDLADKTLQWETTRADSSNLPAKICSAKGGLYNVSDNTYLESRLTFLENQLKGLSVPQSQAHQIASLSCTHCHGLDHISNACPYIAPQSYNNMEQANMSFQRPRNDPYSRSTLRRL